MPRQSHLISGSVHVGKQMMMGEVQAITHVKKESERAVFPRFRGSITMRGEPGTRLFTDERCVVIGAIIEEKG